MNIATSKHCPRADQSLRILENEYSFPEILKLREYIDICEAMEEARYKDDEERIRNR